MKKEIGVILGLLVFVVAALVSYLIPKTSGIFTVLRFILPVIGALAGFKIYQLFNKKK